MPSLGPLEILVVLIVALLVFGPNKLPELARQVGKGLAEFRRIQHHLKGELDDAINSVMHEDAATNVGAATGPPPMPDLVEPTPPPLDLAASQPAIEPPVDAASAEAPAPGPRGPSIGNPAAAAPTAEPSPDPTPPPADPA